LLSFPYFSEGPFLETGNLPRAQCSRVPCFFSHSFFFSELSKRAKTALGNRLWPRSFCPFSALFEQAAFFIVSEESVFSVIRPAPTVPVLPEIFRPGRFLFREPLLRFFSGIFLATRSFCVFPIPPSSTGVPRPCL